MKKIPPFALVGLPGVGKTTIADTIIEGTDTQVVSTDKTFGSIRSNPNHPLTKSFIRKLSDERNEEIDTTVFKNSAAFTAKYGMTAFRDLEELILVDLISRTDFSGKVLDLGGAAFDREDTRNTIKAKGITTIYLKASPELISEHLYKDFLEIKASGQIRRGNYYKAALEAENRGLDVRQALQNISNQHFQERSGSYALADFTLDINENNCSIKETAARVINVFEGLNQRRQTNYNTSLRHHMSDGTAAR